MSSVFLRDNYSDLFGADMLPVLEEMFRSEMDMHPSLRSNLFKTVSTDRDIWQATALHDMALFSEVAEGTDYSFQRPKQGASKTLKPVKYGLGFSISEEAVDDGKFDYIADAIRKMARSARESQEIQAMNIFNNGFSSETASDGVAVFSTSHTLPSGSTWRNRLSTDADLTASSLDQMLTDFGTQQVGDSGIIYNPKPKVLLVPYGLKRYANELIGSDLKADTDENNLRAKGCA
jgi:phage major head subunit gpT-like protein